MRRRITTVAAIGLALIASMTPMSARAQSCETYQITAYAAAEYPGWTADGSTTTVGALNRGEPIVAASYNVPMGAYVQVVGLGSYRVADRGHLGARHIDVLVWSRGEALAFGRQTRTVCVYA